MLKKQNFNWFIVGLLDGDGSIQVNHWKQKYLQYRIMIKLKKTPSNIKMLTEIKNYLKCGFVVTNNHFVIWVVNDKKQIKQLLKFFDKYTFFTFNTKTRYDFFKHIFLHNYNYKEYLKTKQLFIKYLLTERGSEGPVMNKITDLDFDNWLIGFIEAEGCFSIRTNGIKSFSIGQNFGWNIINKIKQKFNIPNIIRVRNLKQNYTNCPPLRGPGKYQINRLFVSIETYNKVCLFKIIDFIQNHPIGLKGEKKLQFEKFIQAF